MRSYTLRLVDYMKQVKNDLEKTVFRRTLALVPNSHEILSPLLTHLAALLVLIDEGLRPSAQNSLTDVVLCAYDICQLYPEEQFETVGGSSANTRSIRNALGFLGRLRTCFNTLVRAAGRLPNFQCIRIVQSQTYQPAN